MGHDLDQMAVTWLGCFRKWLREVYHSGQSSEPHLFLPDQVVKLVVPMVSENRKERATMSEIDQYLGTPNQRTAAPLLRLVLNGSRAPRSRSRSNTQNRMVESTFSATFETSSAMCSGQNSWLLPSAIPPMWGQIHLWCFWSTFHIHITPVCQLRPSCKFYYGDIIYFWLRYTCSVIVVLGSELHRLLLLSLFFRGMPLDVVF